MNTSDTNPKTALICDKDVLYELIDFYSPDSQPWDEEYAYLDLMLTTLASD